MRRLLTGYVFVLLALVVLANLGLLEDLRHRLEVIPGTDKLIHFLLVGTLALLVDLSLAGGPRRRPVLAGTLLVFALVTAEEFSQRLFAVRQFSLGDLAANYAGVLVAGLAAVWIERRRDNP